MASWTASTSRPARGGVRQGGGLHRAGSRRWLYMLLYLVSFAVTMLPLYMERSPSIMAQADPSLYMRQTQDMIRELSIAGTTRYGAWAVLLHVAAVLLGVLVAVTPRDPARRRTVGRVVAAYVGIEYAAIAAVQAVGRTATFGMAVHTGALVLEAALTVTWLWVAIRGKGTPEVAAADGGEEVRGRRSPWVVGLLGVLVLLAFWAPYTVRNGGEGPVVEPFFDPVRLLTAPDFGLTFCFTTPAVLWWLVLAWPRVPLFAMRLTAFNGLLYGVFNMFNFLAPATAWMGVLHLPLLVVSAYALSVAHGGRVRPAPSSASAPASA